MGKKIVKMIFLMMIIFGIASGIYIAVSRNNDRKIKIQKMENVFNSLQNKEVQVSKFYTYGDTLNVAGSLENISKENLENVKLVITNGDKEITCSVDTDIENKLLMFETSEINKAIELDALEVGEYYVLLRVKLNNSANAKYYTLQNISSYSDIEYYTVTKNGENRKITIAFLEKTQNKQDYNYLSVKVEELEEEAEIDAYDIVIDSGHGGTDSGEKLNGYTEANIALDYSKDLKIKLEELGLKVKLTRDDDNSDTYTTTNMYNDNGRITVACESKAKYMFSFHVNNGNSGLSGLEVYAPTKSNLEFAKLMANKIVESGATSYSNNTGYKKADGVFVWNFTKSVIKQFENTANNKGYEPYNITTDTPYQYTIREVGGIATNAYADGRNPSFGANKYYNSNQGIECYQIELGYIKTDLEKMLNNRELYVNAIAESVKEYLGL
jgi:N-acetylmuramoyl-L-alanine amidase